MENIMTTASVISLFDTNKEQRKQFATDIINRLNNGEFDAIKLHHDIKCMEDIIKQISDDSAYKCALLDEATKYGKRFEKFSAKFEVAEVGVKYDYSVCNDDEINDLQVELMQLQSKIKARQEFLKTIPLSGLNAISKHGEPVIIYPPAKTSTTTVKTTLL